MQAARLVSPGGPEALILEEVETPVPGPGDALVRVHAAAITRDELAWPVDRLPAIPSYEVAGEVVAIAPDVEATRVGEDVYALTSFDRDGAAAEFVAVAASLLSPKPRGLDHIGAAAVPMAAESAWQGLFDHGSLREGQRVLILGAAGGVGHIATQLARLRGAHVIGTASAAAAETARGFGAHEVVEHFDGIDPVDLVFDTVGGAALASVASVVRDGGRIVSIAEEPPEMPEGRNIEAVYFVVEPNGGQLTEITRLVDEEELRPAIDSVFPLTEVRDAFERSMARGKAGKVVLRVAEEGS
jgi:NADPH:quinone reductase-like Zn-dependent oxidoreductase